MNQGKPIIAPATAPSTHGGHNPEPSPVKQAADPLVVRAPALTRYNATTGAVEPRGWSNEEEPATTTDSAAAADQPSRHQAWKAQQAEKKAARDSAKTAKATADQALAKDHLSKGDLTAAARSLGLSPADLILLVNNGALGIKAEPAKPLTAAEQLAADQEKVKTDRLAFEEEMRAWKYNTTAATYIEKNITPILADKEAFEFCHAGDIEAIKTYAYQWMNRHYNDTAGPDGKGGVVLDARDVLETIEKQFEAAAIESAERLSRMRKTSRYFQPRDEEPAAEQPAAESVVRRASLGGQPAATTAPAREELALSGPPVQRPRVDLGQPFVPPGQRSSEGRPWHALSSAERLARMRDEEAAERREQPRR